MDGHGASGQRVPPAGLVELPDLILQGEGIVFGYGALGLNRKDPVQIRACGTPEGAPFLSRRRRELSIELRYVAVPQELVGIFPRSDPGQTQFLR